MLNAMALTLISRDNIYRLIRLYHPDFPDKYENKKGYVRSTWEAIETVMFGGDLHITVARPELPRVNLYLTLKTDYYPRLRNGLYDEGTMVPYYRSKYYNVCRLAGIRYNQNVI